MEVRERERGGVAVLDVAGRMVLNDGERVQALKDRVVDLIARDRRHVVINLAGVSQVDTSGLTLLVAAQLAAASRGAHLAVVNPSARLRDLLRVTRLNTLLAIYTTEEEAISRVAHDGPFMRDRPRAGGGSASIRR